MSVVINSNSAATLAARNLSKANDALRESLARLSSGSRINSARDDAGGMSVAYKINSRLSRLNANKQNVQNAVSFLQVQEGALKNAAEIVSRMSELRVMAADVTKNESDVNNYNYEFRELQKELNSLRSEKFNGVSLFGTLMNADENLTINPSDDGTGEGIEISRIGLFENLKSKFGTDGELNSGSHGSYRQLVGEFVNDAGILDASPSYSTRNYSQGDVVYRDGPTDAESGYFMALKAVMAGAKVEDSQDSSSNWIRIADRTGKGFSEIYPAVPEFDQNNLKFNSSGDAMAYLRGDVVKVQAHWADPYSFVYLKANMDVPRKHSIDTFLNEGLGSGKHFEYLSVNRANDQDGRPTTEFIKQNSNWTDPDLSDYDPSSMSSFYNMINDQGVNNNYTPGLVKVDVANDPYLNGTSSSVVAIDPNKQETMITDIAGDMQVKKVRFNNVYGNENDVFHIKVAISENQNLAIKGAYDGTNQYSADEVVSDSNMLNWYKIGSIQTIDSTTLSASLDAGTQAINVGDVYWDTVLGKYLKVTVADLGDPTASPPASGTLSTTDAEIDDLAANGLVEDVSDSVSTSIMKVDVDSTMNAGVNGNTNLAQALLDKILSVKLADGVTDAFDTTTIDPINGGFISKVSNSEFNVGGVNIQNIPGFDVYGTPAARDFYIQIDPEENTGVFDPSIPIEATRSALELESSNFLLDGSSITDPSARSAHPINHEDNQYVTYDFQKKFWGDGSNISFATKAVEGDLAWDGDRFWKVHTGDVGSYDPSDPSIHHWHVQAKGVTGTSLDGIENLQIKGRFDATYQYSTTPVLGHLEVVSDNYMSNWYQIDPSISTVNARSLDSSGFQAILDSGSTGIGVTTNQIFWDSYENEYRVATTITAGDPAVPTLGTFAARTATLLDFITPGYVKDVTGEVFVYEDLEDLAQDTSTEVVVSAGNTNAGAYFARIDRVDADDIKGTVPYIADSLNVSVTSEGANYSIDVDYISGSTVDEGKELTAQAIVDAINSATGTGQIGSVVEAEVVNSKEVKLTSLKSGVPFDTIITGTDNHMDDTSDHNYPSGNAGADGTAVASAAAIVTKAVSDPTTTSGSPATTDAPYSIFKPASDWGIKTWDATTPHEGGELVWDVTDSANPKIWEVGEQVKGYWNGGSVQAGEIFLYNNAWYQADADTSDTPGASVNWTAVDPLAIASTDKTSEYMDLSNTDLWTKTHFGNLAGVTIGDDYQRGDTFLHEGKHYLYVSTLPSGDYRYDPGQTGETDFEILLQEGAVMELPMYVDTLGGGGSSDLPEGVYYRPNQSLEFVDRMPDSGLARANSIVRRGEADSSDEIFNSRDDLYYGGLNPGHDGIYGTSDDGYNVTRYADYAKAGGHVDSDADNNKNLLDVSNDLTDFSVADFVDFIQTIANFRAVNGGTMSRLDYAGRMLDENQVNLESAYGRIMDADIAMESSKFARQNVLVQASASMVAQANQLTNIALTLLGR